jgi:hypothetical protein
VARSQTSPYEHDPLGLQSNTHMAAQGRPGAQHTCPFGHPVPQPAASPAAASACVPFALDPLGCGATAVHAADNASASSIRARAQENRFVISTLLRLGAWRAVAPPPPRLTSSAESQESLTIG